MQVCMCLALTPLLQQRVRRCSCLCDKLLCHMQILATRTESPDIIGALTTLSTFYENNTIQAQRRLRTTIEQHGLSINEQFLSAAEDIIKVRKLPLLRGTYCASCNYAIDDVAGICRTSGLLGSTAAISICVKL